MPLIKKVAQTKKPLILSTGMANLNEITDAVKVARKYDKNCLLYCIFIKQNKNFNLNNIRLLKERFKCKVGLSDHSKDNIVAISAVAAGADMVEKHIALKNKKKD